MSGFTTSNGQVTGPNGQPFVARGIDVMYGNDPTVSQLQTDFPGINFVRLAVYNYDSPQSLASYVNSLTSAGIVVELENHNNNAGGAGGSQGVIFTGSALTQEQNWYSSVASYFSGNPYVWFGTNNEPSETDSNGQVDAAALSAWQETTYNTIRATGNNAPVMLESTSWGPSGTNIGYNAADYNGMHNVIWDQHYYGWLNGYSTDQNTVTSTLNGIVSNLAAIKGADGTMPVIIGEYGNSTNGVAIDPNGNQVISAVLNSGLGNVAWAWGTGNPGDGLTISNGGLSSYGQQVSAGIAQQAAKAPAAPPPSVAPPAAPPSASGTVIMAGSTHAITDASGNQWTIKSGVVDENGQAAGYSNNVKEIAYVNGTVWQENTASAWWGWSNGGWNTGAGTTTSPLPAAPSTISLRISEDAYQGDAQFTVKIDGTQVGGTMTASALHASGDSNVFVLTGNWATGSHQVAIQFLNDAYGGSATTDRNLYVNSIAYNGQTESGTTGPLYAAGTQSFSVGSSVAAASGPAHTVTVHLSEDAWNGNAQFQLLVDGKAVTTPQQVLASHAAGAWQDLSFVGNFGAGSHTIGVQFTNDTYGGTPATDRNLYVNGINVNGTHYGSGVTALMSNGTANFAITTTH